MNLPNILSLIRIALIPIFVLIYFSDVPHATFISAGILLVSFATDALDGYIARRFNMITSLGKVLDPLADKATQVAVVACLYIADVLPLVVLLFFVFKELLILIGGVRLYREKSFVVTASWYGKVGTGLFYSVMTILLLFPEINIVLKNLLVGFVILWALFVGTMYLLKFIKLRRKA